MTREEQLAELEQNEQRLTKQNRLYSVRLAARLKHDALRPEAVACVVALLDWDLIEDELDLDLAISGLESEHDYLFIPELLGRPHADADGGARSIRDDELPSGRVTRRSARDALQRGYGHGQIIESRGASRMRELREEGA